MSKASEAFRTISEVADDLDVPKHVLRFWEVKFPQIRPMKRGGGRRYYRPEDLELLRGIRQLLHAEGYTIKGVQKILREQGIDSVKRHGRSDAPVAKPSSPAVVKRARAPEAPIVNSAAKVATKPSPVAATPAAAPASPAARRQRDRLKAAIAELESCRALLLGDSAARSPRAAHAARS